MKKTLLFVLFALTIAACSDDDNSPVPKPQNNDKYRNGFYVMNEGSYGRTPASINYYDRNAGTWTLNLYQLNNNEEKLGNTGSMAVCDEDNMYVVCKEAPCLVKIGLSDFIRKASVDEQPGEAQARSFALIDDRRGVLTTTRDAYIVSLDDLSLTPFYEGESNALWGDVAVWDNYIFLLGSSNEDDAVMVFDATTLEEVKRLGVASTGFAKAGGFLWAADKSKLLKIDPKNLTCEEIALSEGLSVYYNQWAFTPTCLQPSKKGDALYFINDSEGNGRDAYKFTISTSAATRLFEAPLIGADQYSAYGSCVNVDPQTGDLYLVYAKDYGASANIYVVDGNTGVEKEMIPYTDQQYWYPAMLVFR